MDKQLKEKFLTIMSDKYDCLDTDLDVITKKEGSMQSTLDCMQAAYNLVESEKKKLANDKHRNEAVKDALDFYGLDEASLSLFITDDGSVILSQAEFDNMQVINENGPCP